MALLIKGGAYLLVLDWRCRMMLVVFFVTAAHTEHHE